MRGNFEDRGRLFSYISPERRVPASLGKDSRKLYSDTGRPSIAPEQRLSALLPLALNPRSSR